MYALVIYDQHGYYIENVVSSESIASLKSHIPEWAEYHPTQPSEFLVALAYDERFQYNIIEVTT